jgi:hypothetical protein
MIRGSLTVNEYGKSAALTIGATPNVAVECVGRRDGIVAGRVLSRTAQYTTVSLAEKP